MKRVLPEEQQINYIRKLPIDSWIDGVFPFLDGPSTASCSMVCRDWLQTGCLFVKSIHDHTITPGVVPVNTPNQRESCVWRAILERRIRLDYPSKSKFQLCLPSPVTIDETGSTAERKNLSFKVWTSLYCVCIKG